MVERIVDAGRAVLLERGYDGASTNRIAEKAHISPGSLYQYFPNKDAIVAEVVDRWTSELHTRISRVFTTASKDPRKSCRCAARCSNYWTRSVRIRGCSAS